MRRLTSILLLVLTFAACTKEDFDAAVLEQSLMYQYIDGKRTKVHWIGYDDRYEKDTYCVFEFNGDFEIEYRFVINGYYMSMGQIRNEFGEDYLGLEDQGIKYKYHNSVLKIYYRIVDDYQFTCSPVPGYYDWH